MAVEKSDKKKNSPVVLPYLFLYNFVQFAGWLVILYLMLDHLRSRGFTSEGLWERVNLPLLIFQSGAVMEIIHSTIGIVSSSVAVTLPQVFSRVFLIWPILYAVSESRDPLGLPMLLTAWTITEVMRYLYYALNLINFVPGILQWCRYSFFLLLYPMGITGELICCYRALPHYDATQNFSVLFPNKWNFSFSFYYFIVILMLGYIPVFPQLFGHMLSQRRKFIGSYVAASPSQSKKRS